MALYRPGTGETDPYKINLSLQSIGTATDTNTTNIATNAASIAAIAGAYVTTIAANSGAFTLGTGLTNSTNDLRAADGVTLQTVYAELTTFTSGTTALAGAVDTIPQNTDGTQLLTLAITPKLSTSKLLIRATMPASNSGATNMWCALFQDSTAGALAAMSIGVAVADTIVPTILTYQMTSGATSSTTFKLRIGNGTGAVGTWAVNGVSGGRRLGGANRVTLTVEEIKA